MKKELDEALCKDFPQLYRDRCGDMRNTCMCWGFECGDGWEQIIRSLSAVLSAQIKNLPSKYDETRDRFRASQVKEKFGTLRFYMSYETEEMYGAISMAEEMSAITCEVCGKPGKLYNDGWCVTRCEECRRKENAGKLL